MVQQLEARVRALEAELAEVKASADTAGSYRAQLEEVIDLAPLPIFLKDARLRYLFVNKVFELLAGRGREQIIGRVDEDVFPEPIAKLFRQQDQEVLARVGRADFRETLPLAGSVHSFITTKFPLKSGAGELTAVAGICTEITALEHAQRELQEAQAELVRQERLATLGELSAVIAHEVRNPLAVIFNSLATLRRLGPASPEGGSLLGIIGEEADRLNRMVNALLELGRPNDAILAPTQVDTLLASAVEAARSLADPSAEVLVDVPQPIPAAIVDENMLRQALTNLVANAIQAPRRRSPVKVRVVVEGSETLRFDIVDDGAGVPAELAERIFTPFFTTRAKGTGLGLPIVRRIAEAHLGQVTHEVTLGGGATFVLRIPLSRNDVAGTRTPRRFEAPAAGPA